MHDDDSLQQLQALVAQDFEPVPTERMLTEAQLLEVLSEQIAWMLEHKLEYLMSLMYRLDVPESKVDEALSPAAEAPAHLALAQLILERQKQRVRTKRQYPPPVLSDEDW